MMDYVRVFFRNFIKYFIYIAVFAQIVSGTVYLVCNFADYIIYPETEEMMHVARGLLFDEYTGVLYPLFVRVCLNIQTLCGFGYYLVVHFVQFLLFTGAAYYLAKAFFKGKKAYLVTAYIVSFPMCVQSILMVSPFAFRGALGFFMLGAMVRLWKQKGGMVTFFTLFVSYMLAGLNVTDDLYLWIFPIGILALVLVFRKKDALSTVKKVCLLLTVLLVFVSTFGVLKTTVEAGARGRMQRTASSVLFQRTWWPELRIKYGFLPMEMIYQIDEGAAMESDSASEKIIYDIGPSVDRAVGFEKADALYMEAFLNQLSYNKKAIFKAVLDDFIGYLFVPYSTVSYMMGQEGSAFATLYGLMSAKNPEMTYTYFCIALVSFFVLTFRAVIKFVKEKNRKGYGLLAGLMIYQALWYAIVNVQGVDYRYGLLNIALMALFVFRDDIFANGKDEIKKKKICIRRKHIYIFGAILFCLVLAGVGTAALKNRYEKSDLLSGKKVVCVGDSIWGLVTDGTGIAALVEEMTGATVENYAIPGTTASKVSFQGENSDIEMYSLTCIVEALEKEESTFQSSGESLRDSLEDAEYLIIAYGLNDYFHGIEIESEEQNDTATYKGALSYAVEYFRQNYPELQIVLIGQTYCQFYAYGVVEQDSDTKDFGGGVGTDYAKAVQEVADSYQLIYINQYESLPIHEWNGTLYLEDATHLNERGRREYAKVVSKHLLKDFKERNAK